MSSQKKSTIAALGVKKHSWEFKILATESMFTQFSTRFYLYQNSGPSKVTTRKWGT